MFFFTAAITDPCNVQPLVVVWNHTNLDAPAWVQVGVITLVENLVFLFTARVRVCIQ